jgi:phosphoribosylamine--glycine ligase
MKVLVIGGGGREHALCWKIVQSPHVNKVFCAPGNAGIANVAECVAIPVDDLSALKEFALKEGIALTVVGPELPLTLGIVDSFEKDGLRIFGPRKKAARLEGSKGFSKNLMEKYRIPTAAYKVFHDLEEAKRYVADHGPPLVIKADGLAAGKGVTICNTNDEALHAVDLIMKVKIFGEAGERLVVETFLTGEEASFLAFSDGKSVLPLASSQDHKPIFDGDKGPNTGGMGAYSPAPVVTNEIHHWIVENVMIPTVRGMEKEGSPYKGILYAGLMITDNGPRVLEFNCRFGDPEAQPLLMRMKSDIVPLFQAAIDGNLAGKEIEWDQRTSICVVMASEGYPGDYKKGLEITGLEKLAGLGDIEVFHAGTKLNNGRVVTSGGRVLGITALGDGVEEAIKKVYKALESVSWEGAYYRHDIGAKAVAA